ncbi:MAG: Imm8 family immunity protein [Ferruginibacter sp.]
MKPFIKEFYIQGIDFLENINEVSPCFHLRLEIEINYENTEGVDDYSIDICDVDGLTKKIKNYFKSDFEIDNGTISRYILKTLVCKEYNKTEIIKQITQFVNECSGENWEEVNLKLQEKLQYNP